MSVRIDSAPQTSHAEIEALKRQKLELLEEKKRLKARIARIDSETQKPIRATVNPRIISQLDREYEALQQQIESQRSELDELKMSDAAARRSELQEEVKVVYLERVRLQNFQIAQQQELNKVKAEHEELMDEEGPEVLERQQKKLNSYKEKLDRYQRANHKLAARIKTMRANRAFDNDEGRERVKKRADELRQEIEKVKQNSDSMQDEIETSKQSHRMQMRELRAEAFAKK